MNKLITVIDKWSIQQKLWSIIALNVLILIHGLWVPFYNVDEVTNAIYARFINEGRLGLADFLGNTYLLTHYLYVLAFRIFNGNSLALVHTIHIVYRSFTIYALYLCGRNLKGERTGLWAALFYCLFSTCFMSKDFHTPSAESFTLFPAALSALFLFKGLDHSKARDFALSGFFIGLATLFKIPIGITIVAMNFILLFQSKKKFFHLFVVNISFLVTILSPAFFMMPFGHGFVLMWNKIQETNASYISVHSDLNFLYWVFKFIIRTLLMMAATLVVSFFAMIATKRVFWQKNKHTPAWQKHLFVFFSLMLMLYVVTIGKRIFYHYYVFCLVPLCLLAAIGYDSFKSIISAVNKDIKVRDPKRVAVYQFVQRHLVFFLAFPTFLAFCDGALNFSTLPQPVSSAVQYIQQNTKETDRLYVWGNLPQIYFFTGRQPATPYFWTELLVGSTNSSAALEYVIATRKKLKLDEMLMTDMKPNFIQNQKPTGGDIKPSQMSYLNENDLFTVEELLELMPTDSYWHKVFKDFLVQPPTYIIDTSEKNIRGFGYYPINNYPVMRQFILSRYKMETTRDGLVLYRLNP